ncbi:B- and T-lymphocyte attenuator-like isoform X2 [Anoplopoma fimbria]|uniref:B- and T-lymphocyte attenuator-like isoform X2 n=1 Tax=Anoplopoma fimbria TaxID=229290 RepID=UPI0023EDE0F3|nr:B- and T-lymphocyte attenuator-like isoform X2 [Anoplopoma fimbria]
MRPNSCRTILHVFILAGMLLTLKADSEDPDCDIIVKVNHHTVYEALLGEDLRINCTVEFCNDPPPPVSWYKRETTDVPVNVSNSSHFKTEWNILKHLEGIAFLIFKKVRRNDSGVYQCKSGESVSHNINVSVHDVDGRTNVTGTNDTRSDDSHPTTEDPLMYMYFAAGVVAFVIIVIIISVVSLQGCKGKSKKERQTENQYMAIPMVEQPISQASPRTRGSPSAPPSRRSTRRKTPPSQPNELPLPKDNAPMYGKVREDRERRGNASEEAGSVVYAALNHQPPAVAAARPRRPREEQSEYAAIRVKDPPPLD